VCCVCCVYEREREREREYYISLVRRTWRRSETLAVGVALLLDGVGGRSGAGARFVTRIDLASAYQQQQQQHDYHQQQKVTTKQYVQ
jgi:hypothetical protein